ncbi:MAG: glycosyltransferase [Bacillota bacterium]
MRKSAQGSDGGIERKIKFSIIIPAYNEEKLIKRCLDSIVAASAPYKDRVEIIVVLNRCTDRTEEIALSYNCIIAKEDSKNMAKIRNAGAKAARGEIIVTIDADNWMTGNMLTEIEKHLKTGRYIGGGVRGKLERISLGIIASLLVFIPLFIKYGNVSVGLFWCYKKDFDAINGFNENLRMGEDIDFALRLKKWGKKSGKKYGTITKATMMTSCRKWDMFGDWSLFKQPKLVWGILKGDVEEFADECFYDIKK